MPTKAVTTGWLRPKDAAAYLGLSLAQFYEYQRRGWIAPDAQLPSVFGTRHAPRYRASSLDAAVARMHAHVQRLEDPKSRLGSAEKISAAKKRRAAAAREVGS